MATSDLAVVDAFPPQLTANANAARTPSNEVARLVGDVAATTAADLSIGSGQRAIGALGYGLEGDKAPLHFA